MSQIKVKPMQGGDIETYLDTRYEITEMYKSKTPIYWYLVRKNGFYAGYDLGEHLNNSVVAEFENRPNTDGNQTNDRLPGISSNIPIQLDVSKIDYLNYSFELNLPNPNLSISPEPTEYFLKKSYPTKGDESQEKLIGVVNMQLLEN